MAKFVLTKSALRLPGALPEVGSDSPEAFVQVSSVCLFLGSKIWEIEEAEKCPHPSKWYPYSLNWRVGNDSPMSPL